MGHCDSPAALGSHRRLRAPISGAPQTSSDSPRLSYSSTSKSTFGAALLLSLVHTYRVYLAPFLGGNCKFYPSCSRYAEEAIAVHGARRGSWFTFKRLIRCVPFTKGGIDLVPDLADFAAPNQNPGNTSHAHARHSSEPAQ